MRHISVSVLILGLVCDLAAAQQPDTAAIRAPVVAPRARGAVKREAEQRRRRIDFLDAKTLSPTSPFLGKPRALWGTTLLTSGDEQTLYLLVRRTVSSVPEVHARWDDLVMVRSGNGAIELGDSLVGGRYRAPGERIGGRFTKSHQIVVHAGDLVRIPAAVPHAFVVSGKEPLQYLVIKQRRQELPIRWFGDR